MSAYKYQVTDTHVYFLTGPYSQWYPSTFFQRLTSNGEFIEFNCCEQYMMASKSVLFDDMDSLVAIMNTANPREQKQLGRGVKNFNPDVWEVNCKSVVWRANFAKFSQNREILEYMFAHGTRKLVEGAHYDPIWGVGLAWDDPLILDEANWKGRNLLGNTLMDVRQQFYIWDYYDYNK